ncbi:MAG: DUF4221 domain-containing protein [Sphingobacteriaceae bacterium]|nr:MAG: DUF4221 domain-containing protein [Sphingobacteriaceae bacterium]
MKLRVITICVLFVSVLSACTNDAVKEVDNPLKGKLQATVELKQTAVKKFVLDSSTSPKGIYIQVYNDKTGTQNFTFLNKYNKTIYFYNYQTQKFIKKIEIDVSRFKSPPSPLAYFIKSADSIYVFCKSMELLRIDSNGHTLESTSLIGNQNFLKGNWVSQYPQYHEQSANPFMMTSTELLFPGQSIFSLADDQINSFRFLTHINFQTSKVSFSHNYPRELYGFGYDWNGQIYTEPHTEIMPDGNTVIFSFPVSHNLYIGNLKNEAYTTVFGGSNEAGKISSLKPGSHTDDEMISHIIKNYEYAAIRYDKYRKVFYRIMLKPAEASNNPGSHNFKDKPIAIIVFDENFKYLGETTIGKCLNFNILNTFVTQQGLNIQYQAADTDESAFNLRILNIEKREKL